MPSRHMMHRASAALLAGLAAALAGCSAGDVELNGKIFDAVNASGLVGKPNGKVKIAERQPLVVPPSLDRLPPPGEAMPETADATRQVVDPERAKSINAAELQRQQAEYCKVNYEQAKARGDVAADSAVGPAGPCRPSALAAFAKWNKGDDTPAPAPETAEQGAATPASTGSIGTVTEAAPSAPARRR